MVRGLVRATAASEAISSNLSYANRSLVKWSGPVADKKGGLFRQCLQWSEELHMPR